MSLLPYVVVRSSFCQTFWFMHGPPSDAQTGSIIIPEQSKGSNPLPIELLHACVPAKSINFSHFQHAISPDCWEPWLPNSLQAWCMSGATQVWTTHAPCMYEVPLKVRCFNMNILRMLVAIATMVLLAYAHVHCYLTVDNP